MNVFKFLSATFKFLSATLLASICLFSGCKKEKSIVPENPSVVEITVSSSKGELLRNETVRMYDETSYESFKKNHSTKPLLEITTDSNGMARFTMESNLWFQNTKSREFMFVVLKAFDTDNYQWWSKGGTVNAGKIWSGLPYPQDVWKPTETNGLTIPAT